MKTILVSACLLGKKVRYDGHDLPCGSEILQRWIKESRVVTICPEVSAGLPIPRAPAEILHGDGSDVLNHRTAVFENTGADVSALFIKGARNALSICQENDIKVAVLTEGSPSCGSDSIYNGEFSGIKTKGVGVTTALLQQHGIHVFSQHRIEEADRLLSKA